MKPLSSLWSSEERSRWEWMESHAKSWRAAIVSGDVERVEGFLIQGFSVDFPISPDHSLLAELVMLPYAHPLHAKGLGEILSMLAEHSTELLYPNSIGLIPADFAMVSPNPEAAFRLLRVSLSHQLTQNAPRLFRPNIKSLFSTVPQDGRRRELHERLVSNIYLMQNHDIIRSDDFLKYGMSSDDLDYWDNLRAPTLDEMPIPPQALKDQFKTVMRMSDEKEHPPELAAEKIKLTQMKREQFLKYRL